MFVHVKSKEAVCEERAQRAADLKYDPIINDLHNEWLSTKKSTFFAKKQFEQRKKKKFRYEMYSYFMENYEPGDDRYIDLAHKDKRSTRFRRATDILLDALKDM